MSGQAQKPVELLWFAKGAGIKASATCDRRDPTLVAEEELFEGGVVVGHGDREFGQVEVASQALGEWGSLANGFFDDVGEFGGMGGS